MTLEQKVRALDISTIEVTMSDRELKTYISLNGPLDFDSFIPKHNQAIAIPEENSEFRYGIGDNGVVSFGVWAHDENRRPGHGGLWSSRSGIFNNLVKDIQIVDVVINSMAVSMEIGALQSILDEHFPDMYYIAPYVRWDEQYYKIKKVQDVKAI